MICVTIARTRQRMLVAEHQAMAEKGADLVEWRVDYLQRHTNVLKLLPARPTPVIFTVRRPKDGGRWSGTEEERQVLLRSAIVAGVDYVDLEDDIARKIPRYGKTQRIISHHNFQETPENLEEIYAGMTELQPDIIKLVTMANSPLDGVRLLNLVKSAKVPTIGFCMGEFGMFSRVLCCKFGATFTYAAVSREREVAPGQLTFDELAKLYRFNDIGADTPVYAVLGDPISHSLSPLLHNRELAARNLPGTYVPIRVPADRFEECVKGLQSVGIRGFSVTIPHKEAAAKMYPATDPLVDRVQASNTLYRDGSTWKAANTDYQAAMESLQAVLAPGESLSGKRCIILGAGGVARAIAYGLIDAGAAVVIAGRTSSRAKKLAEELGCRHCGWENRGAEYADVVVNCTPIGMTPKFDESPYEAHWFRDETIVFDTIYTPEQTLFIKEARERGCRNVTGVEMFVRQAAAQFRLFTGQPASLDSMRETLRRAISAARFDD